MFISGGNPYNTALLTEDFVDEKQMVFFVPLYASVALIYHQLPYLEKMDLEMALIFNLKVSCLEGPPLQNTRKYP